jgi:hypothetical protein
MRLQIADVRKIYAFYLVDGKADSLASSATVYHGNHFNITTLHGKTPSAFTVGLMAEGNVSQEHVEEARRCAPHQFML